MSLYIIAALLGLAITYPALIFEFTLSNNDFSLCFLSIRYDIEGVHVAVCSALGHLIARMLAEDTRKTCSSNDNKFSSYGSCSSDSKGQIMYSSIDGSSISKKSTPMTADATGNTYMIYIYTIHT
jgi:hypothetical protein